MSASLMQPKIHVEVSGSGTSVVLAHGFGGSARNFRPQAKALRDEREVVLYDARGHARSEAPDDPSAYDFERLVDDFETVAARSAEPVVAGGLSLGSATALAFGLRRPERVRALVLASPPGGSDDVPRQQWALAFADAIEARGLESAGAEFAWGARARFDPKGAALIRQGLMEHPPHALAHVLRRALAVLPGPEALHEKLASFGKPVLVIAGTEDRTALAPAEALARLLPNAELHFIEGAGHVVNLAAPEAFNELCRSYLSRVDPRGAPSRAQ